MAATHRRGLVAAIRAVLGAKPDAEDVAQVVLMQAWRDLGQLHAPERFPSWLHGIARNRVRDYLRRQRPPTIALDDDLEDQGCAAGPSLSTDEVRDALAALPAHYRLAAHHFYVGGLSVEETAAALAVPAGTVKRRLHEARRRLRTSLADLPAAAQEGGGGSKVLELEELQSLVRPAPAWERVALSPDGAHVAYVVQTAGGSGLEIRVHGLESGEVRAITPGWGRSSAPRWSPDGRLLAFVSDRNGAAQLWTWEPENETVRLVLDTPIVCRMWFEAPRWLPDSQYVLVKLQPSARTSGREAPLAPPEEPRLDVWESPPPPRSAGEQAPAAGSWLDGYRGDVALVGVESGTVQRLLESVPATGAALSPDGRHVAAMIARGKRPDSAAILCDLHLLPVAGGAARVMAAGVAQAYGTEFSWSPSGTRIAYTTVGAGPGQLATVSLDGARQVLHDGSRVDLGNEEGVPPLWSPDGTRVYCWSGMAIRCVDAASGAVSTLPGPEGRSVYGIVQSVRAGVAPDFGCRGTVIALARHRESRETGLWRLSPDGPTPVVAEAARNLVDGVLLGGDVRDSRLVGFVEALNDPGDLHLFEAAEPLFRERRVSRLNPTLPAGGMTARLMPWTDGGGRHRLAAVLLPAGQGPWPTVFHVYGGEAQSSHIHEFACGSAAWNPLLLTTRGYAVIFPDLEARGPDPADEIADQALRCLEAAVAHGYADPARAAVVGHSYGGYSTLATITRVDRFRAAIASAAISDLAAFACTVRGNELLWFGDVEGGLGALHAAPWEAPERYVRNSPLYAVDRVQTPLLMFHGTEDAVPVAQSEAFYAGLRRLDRPAVLVRYRGEGHGFSDWSAETRADYWRRTLAWLERHLRA